MEAINYTTFRKNLATTIDQVTENHNPILITPLVKMGGLSSLCPLRIVIFLRKLPIL